MWLVCGGMVPRGSSYFSSEHTVYPPAGGDRVLSLLIPCERFENMCSDFVDTNLLRI